jgi:hypothetical protein
MNNTFLKIVILIITITQKVAKSHTFFFKKVKKSENIFFMILIQVYIR